MFSLQQKPDDSTGPPIATAYPWFAIRTKSNQEKLAASMLTGRGLQSYLPTYCSRRRWSDRVVDSHLPLFPGYVFCRFNPTDRLPVMQTPGVCFIVGFGNEPAPISDHDMSAINAISQAGLSAEPCPFLHEGQRVRVTQGALEGLEGILLRKRSQWRMVVSISMLQRSISVEIDREFIATL